MEELYRYKNVEEYKKTISVKPQERWFDSRNLGGGKSATYIPIAVKEALADRIFREWNVIDERHDVILNEIVYRVKIQALPDYPNAEHIFFTGTAAKPIQQHKDSSPESFPIGKKGNALEYCLPAARSEAIANALETLGNLFGRNVGRKVDNDFGFDLSYKKKTNG
ncbi:MAG: hypothetical protein ACPGSO_02895 [Vicingaceae bacterium]